MGRRASPESPFHLPAVLSGHTQEGRAFSLPPSVCSDRFFLHVCDLLRESHVDGGVFIRPGPHGAFIPILCRSHLRCSLVVPRSLEQEGLRSYHRILELVRHQRRTVPGDDGEGEVALVSAVEMGALPSPPSAHFAEQTLDFLHQLEDHRLSEQDVDPRVQDGVDGGHADGLQVPTQLGQLVSLASLQLIQKNPELMTANIKKTLKCNP